SVHPLFVAGLVNTHTLFKYRGMELRASRTRDVRKMVRGSSVLVSSAASLTTPAFKSTCDHLRPTTSLRRIPVSKATRRIGLTCGSAAASTLSNADSSRTERRTLGLRKSFTSAIGLAFKSPQATA